MSENRNDWPKWATKPIEIRSPDPVWLTKGTRESSELGKLLSPYGTVKIEHIGSTSVPGLPAKPIIDLMAMIDSYEKLHEIVETMKSHNWNYVPPELDGQAWRRFFVKTKDEKRECHLHLVLNGEARWDEQLKFRDKLRTSPELAGEYAELKVKLANENRKDREAYTRAKSDFIRNVLASN